MPALNSIRPSPAAVSNSSDSGRWNIGDGTSSQIRPATSSRPAPSERFRLVMERLSFLSGAHPPAGAESGQPVRLDSPAHKNDQTGRTGLETAGGGQPPIPQSESEPALTAGALISPANFDPPVTGTAVATSPLVSTRKTGDIPVNSPASLKTGSSGVTAVLQEREKTAVGLTPATDALSRTLTETDGRLPSSELITTNFLSASENGSADLCVLPLKSAPAKNRMDKPEALSPVLDRAPSTAPARSVIQVSHDEPDPGGSLPLSAEPTGELPVVKMADGIAEIQFQPTTSTIPTGARSEPVPIMDSTEAADGMAVAQQDATMKTAEKKTVFSGAKQKLPGAATVATGEDLPGRSRRNDAPATITIRVEPVPPSGDGISTMSAAAKTAVPGNMNLTPVTSTIPQYVERIREMVSLQVMHMQATRAEEMRVVIKPDVGLQLSLHLQLRDGGVEVQAVLDRGNFGLLNRHWPELQQQLELRGVRVAPLANAQQSFGGGSEGFRQPTTTHGQHAGDDTELPAMAGALLPGLPPAIATASASARSSQHLETWA